MNGDSGIHFHEMGLDDRLLQAVAKLGWARPTLVQEKAIPLLLEGKDILIRAKTGSGKTAAYCLPMLQKILQSKARQDDPESSVRCLVLVPSKELCSQATKNIKELSLCCSCDIRVLDVCSGGSVKAALQERPDVVVGTPTKVLTHVQQKSLQLRDSLEQLVMDEADLLFSYGYEDNIRALLLHLPPIYQATLLSATLSEDVKTLKKLVLHNPVTLKVNDSDEGEESRLTQFHIKCCGEDKFLLVYTLLKLGLIRGKTLLFVNHIDRCYRLKLFLEQFSIRSCVLNSELPHNTRYHTVEEFNRGIYDYIIATDESHTHSQAAAAGPSKGGRGRGMKRKRDIEYGVSRGIDFQGVENVINFDFPPSSNAYIHRVGRTARAFDYGTALSLVSPEEEGRLAQVEERLRGEAGREAPSVMVKPYRFRMSEIEGFRYRVTDALRAVTKACIREARLKEIRVEMLNSEKLKSHFEDNPRDLQVLRHDQVLQPKRVQPHLKHIPAYLVPKALQAVTDSEPPKRKKGRTHTHAGRRAGRVKKERNDPLRTFTSKPRKGKRH